MENTWCERRCSFRSCFEPVLKESRFPLSPRMSGAVPLLMLLLTVGPSAAQENQQRYSEITALAVSLAGTLVPVAAGAIVWLSQQDEVFPDGTTRAPERAGPALLMASGIVLGPAFGYWYSGQSGRGWRTVGLRTGLFLLSFIPAFAICDLDCGVGDSEYDVAWLLVATGAGLGAASAVWDIARVKGSVQKENAWPTRRRFPSRRCGCPPRGAWV